MGVAPNTLQPRTDFLLWEADRDQGVYEVPQLECDSTIRARAERFIGSVVTHDSFELSASHESTTSLKDAIQKACEGNAEALQLVVTNVRTDVIERTIKAGHVMKVRQEIDADGHVLQYGQTGMSIQANSLRFASQNIEMRKRTEAETRNLFRIEELNRKGLLNDYVFLVPSRPADTMSSEDMQREGFFVDTMSIAWQANTVDYEGNLTTESAFVAGKRSPSAPRHDAEMVRRVAARFGIDTAGKSDSETIDAPWLVPKHLMPNGVIDLVQLADEVMGGTFFGQNTPPQDYLLYQQQCRQREIELEPTVQEVVQKLLENAPNIITQLDATHLLHELSEEKMLRRAIEDKQINGMVFGVESAHYLEAARFYHEQGDARHADEYMEKALRTANSNSCPGGGVKSLEAGKAADDGTAEAGEDGDCEFVSNECPLCHKKNVRTTVKKLTSGKKHISGNCGCSTVV